LKIIAFGGINIGCAEGFCGFYEKVYFRCVINYSNADAEVEKTHGCPILQLL